MIEIHHIHYNYPHDGGHHRALYDISLRIDAGESLAIMGANGSGKSTLAKCLNGLLIPTRGKVCVDGLDTSDPQNWPQIRRRVGMIFQNPDNQIVSATVEREIAFGLENIGLPYEAMHIRVEEMLNRFKLTKFRHKSPHYLSGGEKQRLALAAVLAMQPQYLILDEPTSLLDPLTRSEIIAYINDLHHQPALAGGKNMSMIFVTQFPEEALYFDRLLILHQGSLVYDGPPKSVFTDIEKINAWGLRPPLEYQLQHLLTGLT